MSITLPPQKPSTVHLLKPSTRPTPDPSQAPINKTSRLPSTVTSVDTSKYLSTVLSYVRSDIPSIYTSVVPSYLTSQKRSVLSSPITSSSPLKYPSQSPIKITSWLPYAVSLVDPSKDISNVPQYVSSEIPSKAPSVVKILATYPQGCHMQFLQLRLMITLFLYVHMYQVVIHQELKVLFQSVSHIIIIVH